MNVGELFVLFGVKTDQNSFGGALKQLAALRLAASAVHEAVVGVGERLVDMALEAAKSGTHILGTAAGLGMSAENFQKWSYVAKQAGGDAVQVARGIGMLERNLHAFAEGRGSKNFKDAMRHIGVTQQQARQAMVGRDGINGAIFLVSDGYKRLGVSAQTAAINQAIAGARNREFLQDLGKGSEFLRAQFEHLEKIGGVVSEDKLQNLKKFQNSLDDVKVSFNGLVMQVVGGLGPEFSKMLDKVTAWIGENKELIGDVLKTAFEVVAFAFRVIADVVKQFLDLVKGAMNGEVGPVALLTVMGALISAAAVAILTVLIPTIVAMGAALFEAMLPILPYTIIIGAIIALVYLLYKHWDQVKAAVKGAADTIWGILKQSGEGFRLLGQIIWDELVTVWDKVVHVAAVSLQKIIGLVNSIIHAVNHIPGVSIGDVDMPDWVKHNTGEAWDDKSKQREGGSTQAQDQWRVPRSVPGRPATWQDLNVASGQARANSKTVNVAPITINITGVKDAADASKKIGDSLDNQLRHASGALGGD